MSDCKHENLEEGLYLSDPPLRRCLDCLRYVTEEEIRKVQLNKRVGCEHKYIHFDTIKRKEDRAFGVPTWKRTDVFYCEKCLDEQRKEKSDSQWERPDWY